MTNVTLGSQAKQDLESRIAEYLQVERATSPSPLSLAVGQLFRMTVRPTLHGISKAIDPCLERGPKGLETWPIWTQVIKLIDLAGLALLRPDMPVTTQRIRLRTCRAEWVQTENSREDGPVVMYMHGGAYLACGLNTHRKHVASIADLTGGRVLNVDYRMLPIHSPRASLADVLSAYRYLLDRGIEPSRIVFAGDSAGGGLSFLAAAAARDEGLPLPAGICATSPWTDFDCESKLAHPMVHRDPMIPAWSIKFVVDRLIGKGKPVDPELSPVNLDLSGLPPVLINVGVEEVLEDDAINISRKLAQAGVAVTRKHWEGQMHVFPIALPYTAESKRAIAEISDFIRRQTRVARRA